MLKSSVRISALPECSKSAVVLPEPSDMVQPSVPCPVLVNRFSKRVAPIMGVLSGVTGRRPLQYSASCRLPLPGKSFAVDFR